MWETLKDTFHYIPWTEVLRVAFAFVAIFNFHGNAVRSAEIPKALWFACIIYLVFGAHNVR